MRIEMCIQCRYHRRVFSLWYMYNRKSLQILGDLLMLIDRVTCGKWAIYKGNQSTEESASVHFQNLCWERVKVAWLIRWWLANNSEELFIKRVKVLVLGNQQVQGFGWANIWCKILFWQLFFLKNEPLCLTMSWKFGTQFLCRQMKAEPWSTWTFHGIWAQSII